MAKETNNLFAVLLFSILWIVRPISYDEMRSAHLLQETAVLANSSSILTKNAELEFLENNTEKIILAKDTNSNGSFFAEGFSPSLPQRPRGRTTPGMNGQNPGQGGSGGNSNPSSGSESASCSPNLAPKATPEVMNYDGLGSPPKTEKEKALEKMNRELEESIQEEDELNARRKEEGKATITLIIKDGRRFFILNDHLRDKYHHAPDLNLPIPETLGDAELARLSNPSLYPERLETFRNREILPEASVEEYGRALRLQVLDPDTKIIKGTLGANMEAKGGPRKIQGYHFYNDRTGFNTFFDENGRQYRTGFKTNKGQKTDIKLNGNIM